MPVTLEQIQRAFSGRYRVLSELGRGGMAAVFRAEDERHGRRVALKVLEPELAQAIGAERFTREIRITARLFHPHIVPLFDSGEAKDSNFHTHGPEATPIPTPRTRMNSPA